MICVCLGSRGAVVHDPESLVVKVGGIIQDSSQAIGICCLEFKAAKKVSAEKLAYDWLVKGRGYKLGTAVETPMPVTKGFTTGEIKAESRHCPALVKEVRILSALIDQSGRQIKTHR